jgi:RNA polymerase sigma-70 factor (ECF subfamily)
MPKDITIQSTFSELQQLVAFKNDAAAFEKLYLLLYKDLHQFAYSIIKSNHIAEEIVSDVFVQVWKNRASLAEVRHLRVFLYVAVKNQAFTYLYKLKKQKVCWIEEFVNGNNYLEESARADDPLNEKELAGHIRKAINSLPVKCRAIFILIKEDGLKYAEAAKLLNLSVSTIENQMGIALKKIAHQLKMYSLKDH